MLIKSYESSASLLFTCITWVIVREVEMAIVLVVWFQAAVLVFMRILSSSSSPPALRMGERHLLPLFPIRCGERKPLSQCSTEMTAFHSAAEVFTMSTGEAFSANRITLIRHKAEYFRFDVIL